MTDEPEVEPIYTLRGNATQMRTIQRALDLFARLGLGQMEEILQHPSVQQLGIAGKIHASEHRISAKLLKFVKLSLFNLDATAGYGIADEALPDVVRIAYDTMAAIRHRLAWDLVGNPPERNRVTMATIDFDDVHPMSAHLLPVITKVEPEPDDVYFPTEILVVPGRGDDLMCVVHAWNPEITVNLTSLLKRSPPSDSLKPGDYLRPGTRFKAMINLAAGISHLRMYDMKYTADLYGDDEVLWTTSVAEAFLMEHGGETPQIAIKALRQTLIDCYRYGNPTAARDTEKLAALHVERWLPLLKGEIRERTIDDLVEAMCLAIRDGTFGRIQTS